MRKLLSLATWAVAILALMGGTSTVARADTTLSETTGGVANTWTNYTNAGGTAGPQIGSNQTVQIACKLPGFTVADGNTWWYRVASSPWNYAFYVSADAFYNNGATSGSLHGTPFVDGAVPDCGAASGTNETTGGVANTWTNYTNAGGTAGPQIGSNQTVQIACKLTGFTVADGNTWWYQIASSPWNAGFYVSADAFYNNGATSGSLHGTPFVDLAVPDCVGSPGGPSGTKPTPSVTVSQGPAATFGYRYAITLAGYNPSTSVSITCYDSPDPGGFYTFALTTDASGAAFTQAYCYSSTGPDYWVVAGGVTSNRAQWRGGSAGGGTGSTFPGNGALTSNVKYSGMPIPPTTVLASSARTYRGITLGPRSGDFDHAYGPCTVTDYKNSSAGWVMMQGHPARVMVRGGLMYGWFDNGGGPGKLGCARSEEYDWTVRADSGEAVSWALQRFDGGALY